MSFREIISLSELTVKYEYSQLCVFPGDYLGSFLSSKRVENSYIIIVFKAWIIEKLLKIFIQKSFMKLPNNTQFCHWHVRPKPVNMFNKHLKVLEKVFPPE